MSARCTFCAAPLEAAPAGVSVRCASCGNLTTTPSLPPTRAMPAPLPPQEPPPAAPLPSAMPFANVDGRKQAASPPPSVVLPSRAGGVDELVGGGITILGIGLAKFVLLFGLGLFGSCLLGLLGLVFHC